MTLRRLALDLSRPATERWDGLTTHAEAARGLLDYYLKDLGGLERFAPLIGPYAEAFVSAEHREEIGAIARLIGRSEPETLLSNFYYEAFRQIIGCTAFACDTPDGPIHWRNLDWWTDDHMLGRLTCIVEVDGAPAGPYQLVSWPGFIGAFSGLAPGRFSITLNAVISDERPSLAPPVVLLIRRAFETCTTFTEAVRLLESSPIAADCLLLVVGTKPGEMAVVERTCTRAAVRGPERGFIVVTNDYRRLDAAGEQAVNANRLIETACRRFDRVGERLEQGGFPKDLLGGLQILADPAIQMSITVQQMAMSPRTGDLLVEIPSPV